MKIHELTPDHFGDWNANDLKYENTDPYADDEENLAESEAYDYEKRLEKIGTRAVYFAEYNVDRLVYDLAKRVKWKGNSPRERYDNEHRKNQIDRLRLFNEAETLYDYNLTKDDENIPKSKFFRHLVYTCQDDSHVVKTAPLSESEKEHFYKSAGDFTKYLSTDNNRERTFTRYVESLLRICANTYGKDSRAMMYLCDDLNQMLAPAEYISGTIDKKSEIIDRLIERKLDVVQKIAMGKIFEPAPSGRVLIGFTGTLDLPKGLENHSVKELVEEGVPSLYGYNENI